MSSSNSDERRVVYYVAAGQDDSPCAFHDNVELNATRAAYLCRGAFRTKFQRLARGRSRCSQWQGPASLRVLLILAGRERLSTGYYF